MYAKYIYIKQIQSVARERKKTNFYRIEKKFMNYKFIKNKS